METAFAMAPTGGLDAERPKRGRRRKRPELSDGERRALRAAQNREATRRSRERTRRKAAQLRAALAASVTSAAALRAERDRLLTLIPPPPSPGRHPHPMSFEAILNPAPSPPPQAPTQALAQAMSTPTFAPNTVHNFHLHQS